MEYLGSYQSDSDGFDDHSNSDTESFLSSDSSHSPASLSGYPDQSSSLPMDCVSHAEEKLSRRKELLSDRLKELQARSRWGGGGGDDPRSWGRKCYGFGYSNSSCSSSDFSCRSDQSKEQCSYWPSAPRIPFVWEEKPGRAKHPRTPRHSFSDCNEEFSSPVNFSDEVDSIDFMSATDELSDHSKEERISPVMLKLPPRLQQKLSTRRSWAITTTSGDNSESPRLCYEDRMEMMSTRNRSYFLPPMAMQKKYSPTISHSIKAHKLNPLQIPEGSSYNIRRGNSLPADQYLNHKQIPAAKNGLDVLLRDFSPEESDPPGRLFILRERILNAAKKEKRERILQHCQRRSNNSRGSQSFYRLKYERDERNTVNMKARQLTKKLCTSLGTCGRSSDVIVATATSSSSSSRPIVQRISF